MSYCGSCAGIAVSTSAIETAHVSILGGSSLPGSDDQVPTIAPAGGELRSCLIAMRGHVFRGLRAGESGISADVVGTSAQDIDAQITPGTPNRRSLVSDS
jgi:hypothetical protein